MGIGFDFRQTDTQLVSVALSVNRRLRRNRETIDETSSATATGYSFPDLLIPSIYEL